MLILAIDTATEIATSALVADGEVLGERAATPKALREGGDVLPPPWRPRGRAPRGRGRPRRAVVDAEGAARGRRRPAAAGRRARGRHRGARRRSRPRRLHRATARPAAC